jgi:hypothetical protein
VPGQLIPAGTDVTVPVPTVVTVTCVVPVADITSVIDPPGNADTISVPVRGPVVWGVKVTETVHDAPPASGAVQPLSKLTSCASSFSNSKNPVDAAPVAFRMTQLNGALAVPTGTFEKSLVVAPEIVGAPNTIPPAPVLPPMPAPPAAAPPLPR